MLASGRGRLVFATVFAAVLAGCGGGGGGSATAPPTAAPSGPPRASAAVSISIAIPSRVGSSTARSPKYVSPGTLAVRIAVNGGTAQTFPVSGGTPCSAGGTVPASGSCTVYSVQAPVGADTFAITLLDGSGHALSQGTVQATIVQDATNTINVTFDGVVATLRVALSNATPPTGTPAHIGVTLIPLDAAGFTIVGAPGNLPAVTISDGDASGATSLYLAGSDGTCNTTAGAPSSSVTTTVTTVNGLSSYTNVCLNYGGQALSGGATLTASIAGGPSATTTLTPVPPPSNAAAGAWVFSGSGNGGTLWRADTNANPVTQISGPNAGFIAVAGITTDASGNVYVLNAPNVNGTAGTIDVFPPTAAGNVAPTSRTQISAQDVQVSRVGFYGPALDGAGSAYIVASASFGSICSIYRVPLTGGASTVTLAGSCVQRGVSGAGAVAIRTDAQGSVYVEIQNTFSGGSTFVKYRTNADGTLTAVSQISVSKGIDFAFDLHGNILSSNGSGSPQIEVYPGADFVDGQNTTVTAPIDTYPGGGGPVAMDPSGNIFSDQSQFGPLIVVPSGSHTVSATSNTSALFLAPPRNAVTGGASISTLPASLETQSSAQITVSETGYSGPFTEIDDCAQYATVMPKSATGPSATFTVTSKGVTGGTCRVTFTDSQQRTATVPVGITAIVIKGSAKKRHP